MSLDLKLGVSGRTVDGRLVINGMFRVYNTVGLPLDAIVQFAADNDIVIDWYDFYTAAVKSKMKPNNVLTKIEEAMGDAFGPKGAGAAREFRRRLEEHDDGG